MNQNEAFDSAAKLYDENRPSYPDESIDWIIKKTKIKRSDQIIEIGAGTGQATCWDFKRNHCFY